MRLNKQNILVFHSLKGKTPFAYFTTIANDNTHIKAKYQTLYQCYNKPSYNKQVAYKQCSDFGSHIYANVKSLHIIHEGITGYNCDAFVYEIVCTFQGFLFTFKITKDNNYVISTKDGIKWLLNEAIKDGQEIK